MYGKVAKFTELIPCFLCPGIIQFSRVFCGISTFRWNILSRAAYITQLSAPFFGIDGPRIFNDYLSFLTVDFIEEARDLAKYFFARYKHVLGQLEGIYLTAVENEGEFTYKNTGISYSENT